MKTFATPGERTRMREFLKTLPAHRVDPVLSMIFEVVNSCPVCGEPVRRCDARYATRSRGTAHLGCPEPGQA